MWGYIVRLYDINNFLTLNDIAEYLTDKCNYHFNLESSIDQDRLISTIVQLVRNDNLHPVFYYSGNVDWLEQKVITNKSGNLIEHTRVLTDITYDIRSRGYYFVSHENFDKLIKNQYSNNIDIINCTIEPYHVEGKQEVRENEILYYRKIKDNFSINFYDLFYPKSDLANFFSQNISTEKLREEVVDLKSQLLKTKDVLVDKSAHSYQRLSEDTEKSYQTTIGLLLELMTTPRGIANKAPFQSQATIIGDILDKDIQGQRKTTLENRFRDANLALANAKKKRSKPN